jgi:hypothetical protein
MLQSEIFYSLEKDSGQKIDGMTAVLLIQLLSPFMKGDDMGA